MSYILAAVMGNTDTSVETILIRDATIYRHNSHNVISVHPNAVLIDRNIMIYPNFF